MLFLGAHDPRKNLNFLLEIWDSIYKETGLILMVTGLPNSKVFGRAISSNSKGVQYLGFVENLKMNELLRGARCLLSPSIYEGFGLPIIEALQEGIPVISTKTGVVQEISSLGINVVPLVPELWKQAIMEFKPVAFKFEWNSWDQVALNLSQDLPQLVD
jgi:glycosyltransferase involved in cell wall biosynthesis